MQEHISKKQVYELFEKINALLNDSDLNMYEINAIGLISKEEMEKIAQKSNPVSTITMCNPTYDPVRKVWYCG